MRKTLMIRFGLIGVIVLLCLYGVVGLPASWSRVAANARDNIRLGLDLRGGSHLVLQVQVQDAVKAEADQLIERLREELRKAGIDYAALDRNDPQKIEEADSVEVTVKGVPAQKTSQFRSLVAERFSTWNLSPVNATDYRLTLKQGELLALKRDTVQRAIQTISNRINGLGLTEPVVQQHGRAGEEHQILVQLPGVDDPARVKEIMGTAAVLEIQEVKDGPYPSREQALAQHGGVLPLNTELVKGSARAEGEQWYLLTRTPVVTGRDVRNARAGQDEFRKWETNFILTQDGGRRFGRFTEANVGNRLAVVLDNQAISVATIQSKIEDQGRITGLGGEEEAVNLSHYLRSGSLPAGIIYLEERTIGPSLGTDSIRRGVMAGVVGLVLVVAVMVLYYKRSGVNAVIALLLNALITVAALSYFDAVWTLPGIAGLILSIGMAVDSNVLIFERIREELRSGKAVAAAVSAGFDRAFLTIIDTHVTTVVASAFLFMFGTGPVKGFAVTLVVGLVANVFTAVFVSR
ncbi:MAG: protein translocase subunit SecD, partial [Acidobacteria bacterium]|nr:protein translocase subunit SecD [Acidobacteriota bacterium]